MKTGLSTIIIIGFINTIYAVKEYAYDIHNDIDCVSKNEISTEEACQRWRHNMKIFEKNHIFCKEITNSDGSEGRACGPTFIVRDDVITKLSYRWKQSDTMRPITVEVDYTGLSYKQQQFMAMVIGTCFVGIIACFYVNGCPDCPDSSCNDDSDFLAGVIVGNMLSDSGGWGSNNYCDNGYSVASNYD